MSEGRPYLFLDASKRRAIATRVEAALAQLVGGWSSAPREMQLIAVNAWEDAAEGLRAASVRQLIRSEGGWLAWVAPDQAGLKLVGHWLGCEISSSSPLVESLEREFCSQLFHRLGTKGARSVALSGGDWDVLPAAALYPGAGTSVLEIDIDGVPFTALAPAELWPEIMEMPASPPSARKLHQAVTALSDSRITLDVRLPAVHMSLAELTALTPGDFLDLQHDLSGIVRIIGGKMDVGLSALLGQHQGYKAIRLNS